MIIIITAVTAAFDPGGLVREQASDGFDCDKEWWKLLLWWLWLQYDDDCEDYDCDDGHDALYKVVAIEMITRMSK